MLGQETLIKLSGSHIERRHDRKGMCCEESFQKVGKRVRKGIGGVKTTESHHITVFLEIQN